MDDYDEFFECLSGHPQPMPWQRELVADSRCGNRLIRIPTGFGKTLGILSAWVWQRLVRHDEVWPRRLVWCLPMRVLVEQTKDEIERALAKVGLLWDGRGDHAGKVGVHFLMGGADGGEWHLYPEANAVLIGTQDMLLSRALNRGYAAPRARWPMEFGLLNQDCLWVMDEVQLMDVGLATSGQLQAFRDEDRARGCERRPCHTWWMSATLQRDWLAKSPETKGLAGELPLTALPTDKRPGPLWESVTKPCELKEVKGDKALARLVAMEHLDAGRGAAGPTLVVVNTVERALQVYDALRQDKSLKGTALHVVHSRFRPFERAAWKSAFLNKAACAPGADRIVVATQVIEAGVDFSAGLLITELAPWPSLVQRFGRCARWGGSARVRVADFGWRGDKARPYTETELKAARRALEHVQDVAPRHLEAFEAQHPELLPDLYPYEARQLLLRHELEELFDTTPDLTGADIDISRFIRSGDERDLTVFWAEVPKGEEPPPTLRPTREALCAVPFLKARDWLCAEKSDKLRRDKRAWVWDWLEGTWRRAERRTLYPGQTVLVAADCGGYLEDRGWSPESSEAVRPLPAASPEPHELADAAQDDESLSVYPWQTIATHGWQVGNVAKNLVKCLAPPDLARIFDLAGRWHDVGKVHPAFNGSIVGPDRPRRNDLAKAPESAWLKGKRLYTMPDGSRRPGFRHELASTLALFDVLRRHRPDHPALLGPWREWLDATGQPLPAPKADTPPTPLEAEILALDADRFDLLAYLVCAHHGKLRLAWHACPADQEAGDGRIRGIVDGESLPALTLADAHGGYHPLPEACLTLAPAGAGLNPVTGAGWTERVLGLLERHGPFALAWLEAILRAADQRASRQPIADPLLEDQNARDGLETDDTALAPTQRGGTAQDPARPHSPQSGPQHGLRGGTGGSEAAGSRTLAPHHATRYLTTTLGILSYAELAPHLSIRVQDLEADIAEGRYAGRTIDEELILEFHRRICGDLVPDLAGRWRRVDVRVSDHDAPSYIRVPMLMRDYSLDLQTRLAALDGALDERILEVLAFAEGRLLWIHPFADFNGRTTRVLLAELLRRLDLPDVDPTPDPGPATARYLEALQAADRADWQPLIAIWRARFEQGD